MANIKTLTFPYSSTGLTDVCVVVKQITTGYLLDHVDGVYRETPANPYIPLVELATPEQGVYERDESRSVWSNGLYRGLVYLDATGTKAPIGTEEMYINADTEVIVADLVVDIDGSGTGDTPVNHDTGGTDVLRVIDGTGAGIDQVTILAILKADYDAGNRTGTYIKGRTVTGVDGRWANDVMLESGETYTIVFYKESEYQLTTQEVTVA